jgi:hypothetical protein
VKSNRRQENPQGLEPLAQPAAGHAPHMMRHLFRAADGHFQNRRKIAAIHEVLLQIYSVPTSCIHS